MNDSGHLAPRDDHRDGSMKSYEPPAFCQYCGAPLNAMFYFCLNCATPFKNVMSVIPPHRPRKLMAEELIELKAPRVWPLFWSYVGALLFAFVFSEAMFVEERPDLKTLFGSAVIFVVTCIFATIYWQSLASQFRQFGFDKAAAWGALVLLVPALGLNVLYHGVIFEWLNRGYFEMQESPVDQLREAFGGEMAVVILFCLLPAITEEIAFRGLVQHWLQVAIKPWHALVVASALFAALHFSIYSFPYLFLVGMLLGWSKWKTGSLYPAMLIHFLHNLAVIWLFTG